MNLILIVASLTLAASFLCSLFEAALYAITPSQVELLKQKQRPGARRLERLRADVEEPIAAILTVNTVAHTIGAAWCGAMVASMYDEGAVAIFAAVFTLAVLALTEILPKSLGVRFAPKIGPRLAWPLQLMTWLTWPIARPTRVAMRWLTAAKGDTGPSEEEVLVFAKLALRGGEVRGEEHTWLRNVLTLDKVRARELMTPRRVVEMLPASMTVDEAVRRTDRWVHSRVPVFSADDPDNVLGVVYRREVFDAAVAKGGSRQLGELCRRLEVVPETMPAHKLLRLFLRRRRHLVALVNEYGSFEGIVTLEDVLESMLGEEIVDEHDEIVDMRAHARSSHPQMKRNEGPQEG